ncbi:hypothetical protein Pcinc_007553 [Petrolisthes cinctipes]|uniref:Uncharacterized protein n=1 Tax=Petrolisthes cinctipes TaxID=88211 RepID=A0AAE1GAR0_PETCI|nr:hypothetical protein Pcinc_007553 [Petrolisthes cinctipes]
MSAEKNHPQLSSDGLLPHSEDSQLSFEKARLDKVSPEVFTKETESSTLKRTIKALKSDSLKGLPKLSSFTELSFPNDPLFQLLTAPPAVTHEAVCDLPLSSTYYKTPSVESLAPHHLLKKDTLKHLSNHTCLHVAYQSAEFFLQKHADLLTKDAREDFTALTNWLLHTQQGPHEDNRAMAPLSSIPEGTLMPPPRPPDLHTPTTGVEVRMVERQLETSNKALATPSITSELSPKSPPATSERVRRHPAPLSKCYGNQCHRLFRRLGHLGHFSRIDSKGCQHSDQPSEQPRLPHQHPKVPPPPFNRRGMVRDSLVPPIRMLGVSGGQTNVHPVIHKACSITKSSLTQAMGTYSQQTQLCHPNTTPQSTPATTTLVPPNSFKPLAPRRSEATASKLSQTPVTVATSQNVVNFLPFPPLRKHDPPLDRCFPFRLGRSHSISSGLRHLGQVRVNLVHKLSRSSSSPSLHSVTQPFKLPTSSIYRQSSSAMCDKQAKMQINLSVTRNLNSQQPSQISQNSHTCFQDFFPSKFKGGQPEQTFKHLNRVVTSKTNLQADSNLERPIRNRSNGNMQKQEATSVLLPSSRPKGSCLKRAGPRLEQMESNLSPPSKAVTPSGAEETGILPSPQSDNSSLVSNGALIQLNTEQVNRPDATQPCRSRKEWVACIREMDHLQFKDVLIYPAR